MSDPISIPNPKSFSWAPKFKNLWYLLIIIGVVSFLIALKVNPQRAWANFLLGYFFWMCISLSGVFFAALQHLTGAYWSVTVRRVAESFIAYLPYSLALFFVLLFGVHHLYEWSHHEEVMRDVILKSKTAYLNTPFFTIRQIAMYAGVMILGGWLVKNSLRQDENGNTQLTKLNAKISAPFMIVFGWLFTFVSFDLLMSLFPHWFSTIFGVYAWSGLFYSGLAMLTLWIVLLRRNGYVKGWVSEDHIHDLGKLMFAFLVFWGYIAFSQFMLIWYANIPEETSYYLVRAHGGWKELSYGLIIFKFAIPFFILISRPAKRNPKILIPMCLWFLAAQWLDLYWLIFPRFFEGPVFGWMEVGIFVGFAGIFFLSVGNFLSKVSLVAIRDPRIEQTLHHHQ